MQPFTNLLYMERRITGSARGLFCALELARSLDARLTVAAVVEDPTATTGAAGFSPGAAERRDAVLGRWEGRLTELAGRARRRGVRIETRLLTGEPVAAVLGEIARGSHDLLVKVAESDGLLWPWRVGLPDRRLLRGAPCPVWTLDPAQGGLLRVVLAAVDVSPGRNPLMNERIVAVAAGLAERSGARLHVVHACSVPGSSVAPSHVRDVGLGSAGHLLRATARERRRSIEKLLARVAPGRRATLSLRPGGAVPVVRREARLHEADVVVVGNSHRTGLGALVPGNMAERLLGRIPSSVLSLGASPARADVPCAASATTAVATAPTRTTAAPRVRDRFQAEATP